MARLLCVAITKSPSVKNSGCKLWRLPNGQFKYTMVHIMKSSFQLISWVNKQPPPQRTPQENKGFISPYQALKETVFLAEGYARRGWQYLPKGWSQKLPKGQLRDQHDENLSMFVFFARHGRLGFGRLLEIYWDCGTETKFQQSNVNIWWILNISFMTTIQWQEIS